MSFREAVTYAAALVLTAFALLLAVAGINAARAECSCYCAPGNPTPAPICTELGEIGTCWGSCPVARVQQGCVQVADPVTGVLLWRC